MKTSGIQQEMQKSPQFQHAEMERLSAKCLWNSVQFQPGSRSGTDARMKSTRVKTRVWVFLAVLAAVLFVLLAANAGKLLVQDVPRPADVILVLAGETDRRPARALELLDQGYGRRVVIDVPVSARIYDFNQVELAEKYVQHLRQGALVRICPITGLSTMDEARDAAECLSREEAGRVLIVTSDFHTRRALSTFRRVLPGKSFSVAAAYDETQFGTRWWAHRQWAKTCVDEWMRLLWWTVVDRWR
jgi:uncharacterized SAM-binding protein YcdF (DUF218 family)